MAYDKSPGASRLARVISSRVKNEMAAPLSIDFGRIQANGSLLTDTFPVPVPKGEYSVCRHLKMRGIAPGDRVLVAWVQSEAVVVDIVVSSGEVG